MNHKVIDNFLDEEYFVNLESLLAEIPWRSADIPTIWTKTKIEDKIFFLSHIMYAQNTPTDLYERLIPLLQKLGSMSLIRIKANLYPTTEKVYEHPMHIDYEFPHTTAILSMNTCDGYTKLEDNTKIDSVANRVLVFDSSKDHCSTTTTNASGRFNININYIDPLKKT